MKKIVQGMLAVIMAINLSACSLSSSGDKSPGEQMYEMGEIIIGCFENKDKDGLIALFSENAKRRYSLEKEIETAFEFFDSEIAEYGEIHGGAGGGSSTPEGWVEREGAGYIEKIITKSGTTYRIIFGVCLIDKNDEDNVGVTDITIKNEDVYETYGAIPEFKFTIGIRE